MTAQGEEFEALVESGQADADVPKTRASTRRAWHAAALASAAFLALCTSWAPRHLSRSAHTHAVDSAVTDLYTEDECASYLETDGCGWTEEFNCPQQQGSSKSAENDSSVGYACCCSLGLWKSNFDCQIEEGISVGNWSAKKREWCCANEHKGCQEFLMAQFIGFTIHTFPKTVYTNVTRDSEGKIVDADPYESVYVGDQNETADVLARFDLMMEAVETAKSKADLDSSPSTLKIFMAPEFFFRGNEGAYNATDVYDCLQDAIDSCENAPILLLLEEMRKFASEDRWTDWLFVFGTVVAQRPSKTDEGGVSVYNVAPVIRGGPNAQGFLVSKAYISPIDFIECRVQKSPGTCTTKKGAEGLYGEVSDAIKELAEPNWQFVDNMFEVGGVFFGVEICLDHDQHVLEAQLKKKGFLPGGGVQVQLVTSAGMTLEYGIVPNGAPVFLQDGGGKPGQSGTTSGNQPLSVQADISAFGEDWAQDIEGYFDIFQIDPDTGTLAQVNETDNTSMETMNSDAEPKLKVFAPLEIPPSARFGR